MTIQITIDVQYVDEDKAVFHVTRSPVDLKFNSAALGGMMASALRIDRGGEYKDWIAKLAPLASTEGSTWIDRRTVEELDRDLQETWAKHEITIRFWTDKDSPFKLQPDGSYLASIDDLARGRARKL